jgi:hypothetical protein
MVEGRPWGANAALLPELQAKFNTYLEYVSSGRLTHDYPDVSAKRVCIQLRASHPPGDGELKFIQIVARQHLKPSGIRCSWKVIGQDGEHDI